METADDYLLPYLRSLRDPSKIDSAIIEGPAPLLEGTAFPINPFDGQLFKLTQKVGDNYIGVYQYDIETTTWTRFTPTHLGSWDTNPTAGMILGDTFFHTTAKMLYRYDGSDWVRHSSAYLGAGTSFPTEGLITGDTFFRTDLKLLYTYDGTGWGDPVTRSHDSLTDVSSGDHHAAFTSGQHAAVDHTASMLKKGVQPFHSNVAFSPKTGATHNQVQWEAGVIKFADGETQNINAGNTTSGIPNGEVRYIYFTVGSATLTVTAEYGDTIGDTVGILAVVGSSTDNNQEIYIQAFYSKGLNIIADVLAANCILGQHITATEWITAKNFRTAISPAARIEFNSTGICGYSDATTQQFYALTSDGKLYAAGGNVILDSYGISVVGEKIRFKDSIYYGYIGADHANTRLKIRGAYSLMMDFSNPGKFMFLNGDVQMFGEHEWVPQSAGLGYVGTATKWFREVHATDLFGNPHLAVVTSKPAPGSGYAGRVIRVRSGTGAKTYIYVCVQNDANAWEWVQIGVST